MQVRKQPTYMITTRTVKLLSFAEFQNGYTATHWSTLLQHVTVYFIKYTTNELTTCSLLSKCTKLSVLFTFCSYAISKTIGF